MATSHGDHAHGRQAAAVGQARRSDPTRTKTARRRFAGHLRQRLNAIKYHVNRGVVERDAFNLTGGPGGADIRRLTANVPTDDDLTPGVAAFDFPSDREALEAFDAWLETAVRAEVLEEYAGDQYIRQGYGRGVKHADSQIRANTPVEPPDEGVTATLRRPVHRDQLELLYGRAYQELEGVTAAMAQEMRRELAEGLAAGVGPRDLARDLNDRVENVGKTRATVLARTEVVRAHAEGTLGRYGQQLGDDVEVTPTTEILVADDARVCDICDSLRGSTFTLKEARGTLPIHPQCRCAWTIGS